MSIIESIVLGLTQGLTEFIPVSSSGHLEIVQHIFGNRSADFHFFLELINFGTLLALLIFYRKRIVKILVDIFKRKNYRLGLNILITSIPAGLIGFLLSSFISDNPFFSSMYTIGIALGLVGLIMIFIDKLPHLDKVKDEDHLSHPRALLIGLVQTFALIPGVSRSGSTIITGKLVGLSSKSAAEYSFLASIPIMCGVCLKSLVSSSSRAFIAENLGTLALINVIAFISGLAAIYFIMKYIGKGRTFQGFGYYRVVLSMVVLILALIA